MRADQKLHLRWDQNVTRVFAILILHCNPMLYKQFFNTNFFAKCTVKVSDLFNAD